MVMLQGSHSVLFVHGSLEIHANGMDSKQLLLSRPSVKLIYEILHSHGLKNHFVRNQNKFSVVSGHILAIYKSHPRQN